MVNNVKTFQLSETCLDVFLTNYLCPLCHNQPLMCPERCNETVIGCVSPLNQAIIQLEVSLKLSLCKSIIVIYSVYS